MRHQAPRPSGDGIPGGRCGTRCSGCPGCGRYPGGFGHAWRRNPLGMRGGIRRKRPGRRPGRKLRSRGLEGAGGAYGRGCHLHQPAGSGPQIRNRCRGGAQVARRLCRSIGGTRHPLPHRRCRRLCFPQPRGRAQPRRGAFSGRFVGRTRLPAGGLLPFRAQHGRR